MKKLLLAAGIVAALYAPVFAQGPGDDGPGSRRKTILPIKARTDHLSGTKFVVVINYLPSEITSITCEKWVMLGVKSWKDQNDFTIPAFTPNAGPSIAILDAEGFNGYCASRGSIVAHTDDQDWVGTLDRGDGNWKDSTKLTFMPKAQ
jgi:hypothetical protein